MANRLMPACATRVSAMLVASVFFGCVSTPDTMRNAAAICGGVPLENMSKRYAELTMAMDFPAMAALFAEDGELVNSGSTRLRGAREIGKFLAGFTEFKVLTHEMTVMQITGSQRDWQVDGRFRQQVRLPDKNVVVASGRFSANWVCAADNAWRLRRMATSPAEG